MRKRLVAGFCSNLGARGLFRFSSCSLCSLLGACWLAPGGPMGAGNPTISGETETQVRAACQPRQPHMCIYYLFICLFSEMFEKIQMSWYSTHRNFFYVFWILIFCCLHESQILFYFVFDLFIFFTVSVAKQKFLILIDIYQSIRCLVFSFSL